MKTYKFKLYRNSRKERYLRELLSIAVEVYNYALQVKKDAYKKDKTNVKQNELQRILKERRNSKEYAHWKKLHSQVIQQITNRIYTGYELFFSNIKTVGRKASPPKFRKPKKYCSLTFKQFYFSWNIDQSTSSVRIGKYWFKYHNSREVKGKLKTLTVKKNRLGEFFIFITTDYVEENHKEQTRSSKSVGFDFGLKTFLTSSNNKDEDIISPLFLQKDLKKIKQLHKQVSSKKKGSKNRKRVRRQLTRAYIDITNKRNDWQWKLTLKLVKQYDTICLETLNIEGMKRLWGRKISDLCFYQFTQLLQWQASKHNCKIAFIPRFYPSSKQCSICEAINNNLTLKDREWDCSCGIHHNRDRNAAKNIHRVGISTLAGDNVRLPPQKEAIVDDSTNSIVSNNH